MLGQAVMNSQCRELFPGVHSSAPCMPALLLNSGCSVSFQMTQTVPGCLETDVHHVVCLEREHGTMLQSALLTESGLGRS